MKIKALLFLVFSFPLTLTTFANSSDSTQFWKEEAMRLSKIDRNASNLVYERWRKWAHDNNNIKDEIFATRKIGINFILSQKYDTATTIFLGLEPKAKELEDYEELGIIYNNIGYIKFKEGHLPLSITYFKKALAVYKTNENEIQFAKTSAHLAVILKRQGLYKEAMKLLYSSLEVYEQNNLDLEKSNIYNTIAGILQNTHKFNESLRYFSESLDIRKKHNEKRLISSSYNNIGQLYKEFNKLDSAIFYYNLAIEIKKELKDTLSYSNVLINLSNAYYQNNQLGKAKQLSEECLVLLNKFESQYEKSELYNLLGSIELSLGNINKSEFYAKKGEEIILKIQNLVLQKENLLLKINISKKRNNFNYLSKHYEKLISLNDSILNKEKDKSLTEMQIRYDVDKQKKENELLSQQTKSQQAELEAEHLKNLFLIFGTIAFFIISIILYFNFRQRSKHNHMLQELLVEQQHRVKNFLNTIASIFRMHERRAKDDAVKEAVREGSDRLNAMLLIHKQLDQPSVDAPANLNFTEYTLKLVDQLKAAYSGSESIIATEMDLDSDINLDVNKAVSLGLILNEVVTNAFKYAVPVTENPSVVISLKKLKEEVVLSVQDNGPGIKEENKNGRNSSLGLKLIQLFTKNLNASYDMRNNNGTLVEIKFTA